MRPFPRRKAAHRIRSAGDLHRRRFRCTPVLRPRMLHCGLSSLCVRCGRAEAASLPLPAHAYPFHQPCLTTRYVGVKQSSCGMYCRAYADAGKMQNSRHRDILIKSPYPIVSMCKSQFKVAALCEQTSSNRNCRTSAQARASQPSGQRYALVILYLIRACVPRLSRKHRPCVRALRRGPATSYDCAVEPVSVAPRQGPHRQAYAECARCNTPLQCSSASHLLLPAPPERYFPPCVSATDTARSNALVTPVRQVWEH